MLDDLFEIEDQIGAGGFGAVYRASHTQLGHLVAIKVLDLPIDPAAAETARTRLHREAIIGARIRSANLVDVIDAGETPDGSPYLVMSLVRGPNLAELLADGPLPAAAAVDLGIQVAAALAVLDAHGVVHRDVKPHNIALERDASGVITCKLLDFGISKLARAESGGPADLAGTPRYMAPEQIRGDSADARSDIYSLACVLFEAISGEPHRAGAALTTLIAHARSGKAPRSVARATPAVPTALAQVVDRALSDEPAQRPSSALELRKQLEEAADASGLARGRAAWDSVSADYFGSEAPEAPGGLQTKTNPFTSRGSRKGIAGWVAVVALMLFGIATAARLFQEADTADPGPKGVTTIEVEVQ